VNDCFRHDSEVPTGARHDRYRRRTRRSAEIADSAEFDPERSRRDSCHYYLPFLAAPCWMVAAARASVMAPIGRGLVRTDTAELAVGLAAASESRKPSLVDSLDRTSQPNSGACELHSVNVCRGSTCCRSLHCHAARMSPLLINDSEAHKRVKRGERRMVEHPLVNIYLTQELADPCCKHWCKHCLLALRLAISLLFGA
jgi:hypothetical protein